MTSLVSHGPIFLIVRVTHFFIFKAFHTHVEKELSLPLSYLRMDRGGKYMLVDFNQCCLAHNIHR